MIWVTACCTLPAGAQNNADAEEWKRQPTQFKAEMASFTKVLERLKPLLNRSICADGEPVTTAADIDVNGKASDVLDAVADAYDYVWSVSNSGVILMNKRYRNPLEHPQTHVLEMRQTAQDVLRLLSRFSFDLDLRRERSIDQAITRSFSESQVQAIAAGEKLRISAMPPEQRDLISQYVYHHHFASTYLFWSVYLLQVNSLQEGHLSIQSLTMPNPQTGRDIIARWLDYTAPNSGELSPMLQFALPETEKKKP